MKTGYKRVSGRTNNRPLTERKLIDAVGTIIKKHGYKGLTASAIASEADVSRPLINKYFGSLNGLIEKYVNEKDYWIASKSKITEVIVKTRKKAPLIELLVHTLQEQFRFFYTTEEMQQLILWEISEQSQLMNSIGNARESIGQEFFEKTARHFEGSDVNFKAIAALLVSGIYYLVLHGRTNSSLQCGIDINTPEGQCEISKAIRHLVTAAFNAGKNKTPLA
ncbi:TetR/AcrR family transcriptional regulator [Mucilaginibacter lappiensis]|uniref:AcrR family transcriptional regulator n=1 Tax=Mucilaginibacter lappiensis TaxID=354630 RepID=A0A841JV85_9SPHI|nr:TetR/AcrR family transcriptional regulator [Mucilaginibacter lappiensis]MBB6131721.1 AcrR family transcriptional regulator [Mucilaginibacter lappiensis]